MKFSEYVYIRPDFKEIEKKFNEFCEKFENAATPKEAIALIDEIGKIRSDVSTMINLAQIRHSVNTFDEFYNAEQEYLDEYLPIYSGLENKLSITLFNSKFKDDLIKKYGKHFFNLIEVSLKTFKPEIIEDLQEENKLATEYGKLIASSNIEFDGKSLNLSQLKPYTESLDRETRKKANDASCGWFKEHEQEFDDIYDGLVKVRTRIAKKLGYKNYVELGYNRLGRTDYNSEMVAKYREQIKKYVVPLASSIVVEQGKRINIDDLKNYDLNLFYLDGNPKPVGNVHELVEKARTMYHEMSKEAGEFFDFMCEHELFDLEAKKGKESGGYCTYIENYQSPFIFANFNGTSGDVDVLTHEAGHAFQVYSSRDAILPEYLWPTYEAAEIHSMSMEFFAHPWMQSFFEKDAKKYLYSHVCGTITFLPYGACVDEFQHAIYENPEMTKEERKETWRKIEKQYLPYKIYDNEVLERGTFWFRQGHIFSSPFYYIDYTLAQVCAQQFFIKNLENHDNAWHDYYELCKAGGSKPFTELLKVANLNNPFEEGSLENVMRQIALWLEEHKL